MRPPWAGPAELVQQVEARLASLDGRGYLRIEGRIKDMIIRGGENIYPREIEDVLFAHPAVAEAVVIGVPDQTWGEVVAAYVRPVPGQAAPDPQELRAHCRERLAPTRPPALAVRRRLPHDAVRQDPEVQAAGELHPGAVIGMTWADGTT